MSLFAAIATAFTAASIEGLSIIDEAQKRQSHLARGELSQTKTTSIPSSKVLVFPTLVYGILSLPLSAIGASPSLYLISKLTPFHPHLEDEHIVEQEFDHQTSPTGNLTSSSSINFETATLPHRRMKLDTTKSSNNHNDNDRSQFTVKQKRAENRQILAAMKERRERDRIQSNRSDVAAHKISRESHSSQSSRNGFRHNHISSYITTLDGRPLPTSLAESMRRVRILAFGYGLVSAIVVYHLESMDNKNFKTSTNDSKQNSSSVGRDPKAVENFIKHFDRMNHNDMVKGVAMRLFHDYNEFSKYSTNHSARTSQRNYMTEPSRHECCVLPITSFSLNKNTINDDILLHWFLGRTEADWNALPISPRWLFQPTGKGKNIPVEVGKTNHFILLETNLISSLQESVEALEKRKMNDLWQDKKEQIRKNNSLVEAQKVDHVASSKLFPDSNHEVGVVNVFVGNGVGHHYALQGGEDHNHIYINGLDALARNILEEVESMRDLTNGNGTVVPVGATNVDGSNASDNGNEIDTIKHSSPIQIVDGLGRYIRLTGQIVMNHLSKKLANFHFQKHNRSTIHMYSDSPEMMSWIEDSFQKENVRVHLYLDQETVVNTSLSDNDIILVMCSSDSATINITSLLLQKYELATKTNCISVLENTASKETLNVIAKSSLSHERSKVAIICLDSIVDELFSYARENLRRKKS